MIGEEEKEEVKDAVEDEPQVEDTPQEDEETSDEKSEDDQQLEDEEQQDEGNKIFFCISEFVLSYKLKVFIKLSYFVWKPSRDPNTYNNFYGFWFVYPISV